MKKIISTLLIGVLMLSLSTHLIFANEVSKDGGELLKELYESEIKLDDIITLEDVKNYEASVQSTHLSNIMEVNTEYAQYYGGSYVDGEKVVVLLTQNNDSMISFCENNINQNASYELCEVSLAELKAIKTYICDYIMNYVESDVNEINELIDSIVSVGTYIMQNKVFVEMINCTDEKIELFKKYVIESEYIVFEDINAINDDVTSLKPGQYIYIDGAGGYSMGFRCKKLKMDGTYQYGFVTAAHGNREGNYVKLSANGVNIGYIELREYTYGGTVDASFVYLTNYSDFETTNIISGSSTEYLSTTYSENWVPGTLVYKSGATTGITSGQIASNDSLCITNTGKLYDTYKCLYSSAPGDSGGIIYTGTGVKSVVGIHKSSSSAYTYAVKVENICETFDVTLY